MILLRLLKRITAIITLYKWQPN